MTNSVLLLFMLSTLVVPAAANAFSNGLAYMPIYLGIATGANVFLGFRAFQAWRKSYRSESMALTTLLVADLAWALPCFIQCVGAAVQGNAIWGGSGSDDIGCKMMGFYSAFATYSSQMATLLVAFVTYKIVFGLVPQWWIVAASGLGIMILSGLIAMIPLLGVSAYIHYTGFCYIDYTDVTHIVLWLLIMIPCVVGVLVLYSIIFAKSDLSLFVRAGLLGFWVVFLCGWILGIPLVIIGQVSGDYPDPMQLLSAIMGHLMNLLNPLLYGGLWYQWFIKERPRKELSDDEKSEPEWVYPVGYDPAYPMPEEAEAGYPTPVDKEVHDFSHNSLPSSPMSRGPPSSTSSQGPHFDPMSGPWHPDWA